MDNLMSVIEAMVGIRLDAMLGEELSFIQHVSQDLAETVFFDECKRPSVTDIVGGLGVKRQSIGDEQKVFKELRSDI